MKLLDLTLPTAEANLALDEALLEWAESGQAGGDVLRLWEPERPVVVVGRSSKAAEEVELEVCAGLGVPVLRRCSGGAAIITGPGCLMYAAILEYAGREQLRLLDEAHRYVLEIVGRAVNRLGVAAVREGTSDLAVGGRKFSGNSVRCKRGHLLYHGTLLYNFDLSLVSRCLRMPPRQPEYRESRTHAEFLCNVPASGAELREALAREFAAAEPLATWPLELTDRLVVERYSRAAWNRER